jgi:GNAT superfamily N-acetyltransferase
MVIHQAACASADLDAIVHHRRAMFLDMGYPDDPALSTMADDFRPWLQRKMEAGEYLAWFVLARDSTIAAGLGLWLMDWPAHMVGAGSRWRGNILNVYTEPAHRRGGMARALMKIALDWWQPTRWAP